MRMRYFACTSSVMMGKLQLVTWVVLFVRQPDSVDQTGLLPKMAGEYSREPSPFKSPCKAPEKDHEAFHPPAHA